VARARYRVLLTLGAERDLAAIYDYGAKSDGPARADIVPGDLMGVVGRLSEFPERGPHPAELAVLGIRDFRQTVFTPYRVIYRVIARKVYFFVIADGRRDMQSLLAQRLLKS